MEDTAVAEAPAAEEPEVKVSDDQAFGAYGHAVPPPHADQDRTYAQAVREKLEKGMGFSSASRTESGTKESDKEVSNWFRRYGITTTDPVDIKLIWSPSFANYYANRPQDQRYIGRLWRRIAGRFIVGTAGYAIAQMIGNNAFKGYTGGKGENALQHVAHGIDMTLGNAVKGTVYAITRDEKKALNSVMFRNTRNFNYTHYAGKEVPKGTMGRGWGQEIVEVTWDFAFMSFWNYMTGYFLSIFDKKDETKWRGKNGKIDVAGGLKETGAAVFKGITYAAGEDMFVSSFYVNYMKWQSGMINKFSPGFQHDDDNNKFGASYKVDKNGKIIGDYNLEGVLGLTGRFSMYNVGTKMFRSLYNAVEKKLLEWWRGDFKEHPDAGAAPRKKLTFPGIIKASLRYTLVTFIDIMFFMIPAAFGFGVLRTPQYKDKALLIDPARGVAGSIADKMPGSSMADRFTNKMYDNPKDAPLHSYVMNPIGKFATCDYANLLNKGVSTVIGNQIGGLGSTADFTKTWAMAAVSYTPYFMFKSDMAAPFLDTNRSKFVLGGFLDATVGLARTAISFDGTKIKSAYGDVKKWWHEVCLAMIKQPSREYESKIQVAMDEADYGANEGYSWEQGKFVSKGVRREELREEEEKEASAKKSHAESVRNKSPLQNMNPRMWAIFDPNNPEHLKDMGDQRINNPLPATYAEKVKRASAQIPLAPRTHEDFATQIIPGLQNVH